MMSTPKDTKKCCLCKRSLESIVENSGVTCIPHLSAKVTILDALCFIYGIPSVHFWNSNIPKKFSIEKSSCIAVCRPCVSIVENPYKGKKTLESFANLKYSTFPPALCFRLAAAPANTLQAGDDILEDARGSKDSIGHYNFNLNKEGLPGETTGDAQKINPQNELKLESKMPSRCPTTDEGTNLGAGISHLSEIPKKLIIRKGQCSSLGLDPTSNICKQEETVSTRKVGTEKRTDETVAKTVKCNALRMGGKENEVTDVLQPQTVSDEATKSQNPKIGNKPTVVLKTKAATIGDCSSTIRKTELGTDTSINFNAFVVLHRMSSLTRVSNCDITEQKAAAVKKEKFTNVKEEADFSDTPPSASENVTTTPSCKIAKQESKTYKCTSCTKTFHQKGGLIGHIRTHTGEKPYKCPSCEKSFSHSSNLTKHIRTHTGEKPYACATCTRSFAVKCDLINHIGTHTGVKPYQCPSCTKTFRLKGGLISHIRTHTGEKPYECPSCEKSFRFASDLTRHIRCRAHAVIRDNM